MLDGKLVVNFDEIPFSIKYGQNQYVRQGERIALDKATMHRLKKYREGTIGMFLAPGEVLLIIIIYRKAAGSKVRSRLERLNTSGTANIFVCGTKSGSMTSEVWPLAIEMLAKVTRERRGVVELCGTREPRSEDDSPSGADASRDTDDEKEDETPPGYDDWQYGLALYVDSYRVHLERSVALSARDRFGIYIRPLLRNASHLQQPVDRNVGKMYKDLYRRILLNMNGEWLNLLLLGLADRNVDIAKWEQLCTRAHQRVFNYVRFTISPFSELL